MRRGPYGLVAAIREAWARVREGLDEGEVARRLARRSMVNFRRPPRGWCLVVRASDTRINPGTALVEPWRAADARDPNEHEVVLTPRLVWRLCQPVVIEPPGETLREVAAKLGVTRSNLHVARFHGVFRSRYRRVGGRGGAPVALLYTEKVLDPNGPMFRGDAAWNLTGAFLPALLPWDFEQRVVRVPRFEGPGRLDPHPHDPAPKRSYRLPPPEPDYVWHKWKEGEYVGDAADAVRARRREAYAERRQRGWRPNRASVARGGLRFRGWMFVCPGCKKVVQRLYCPAAALRLSLGLKGRDLAAPGEDGAEALHTFACRKCHRVIWASVWGRDGWNLFIGHVSGGLLYGREVARPAGMEGGPVRAYRPVINRRAPKRERVLEGLLGGKTVARIADEMGIRTSAVRNQVSRICRQERAADRHELARKLGSTAVQPVNEVERAVARAAERRRRVVELLREGLRDEEIRSRLSITCVALKCDLEWLYRRHGIKGQGSRRALAEKLGWRCPETRGEEMRRRVAELRAAGLMWAVVGKALGVSGSGAQKYAKYLDRPRVPASRARAPSVVR